MKKKVELDVSQLYGFKLSSSKELKSVPAIEPKIGVIWKIVSKNSTEIGSKLA